MRAETHATYPKPSTGCMGLKPWSPLTRLALALKKGNVSMKFLLYGWCTALKHIWPLILDITCIVTVSNVHTDTE